MDLFIGLLVVCWLASHKVSSERAKREMERNGEKEREKRRKGRKERWRAAERGAGLRGAINGGLCAS